MTENCPMRHENGNCIPAGGFCTANKNICEALLNAYKMGKAQLSQEGTTSDLISRQAAIDALNKQIQQCRKALGSLGLSDVDKHAVEVKMASLRAYRKMLENLPTIQPEPQEGQWIDKGWDGDWAWQIDGRGNCWRVIECSECGKRVLVESNFCPNCGAKMKGVQNG